MTSKLSKKQKQKEYFNQLIQTQLEQQKKKEKKVISKQMKQIQDKYKQEQKKINNSNNNLEAIQEVCNQIDENYLKDIVSEFGTIEEFVSALAQELPENLAKIKPEQAAHTHIIIDEKDSLLKKQKNIYNFVKENVEELIKDTIHIYKNLKINEQKSEENRPEIIKNFLETLIWLKEKNYNQIYQHFQQTINPQSSYKDIAMQIIKFYTGNGYVQMNSIMTNTDPMILYKSKYILNLILRNYTIFDPQQRVGTPISLADVKILYRNIRLPKDLISLYTVKSVLYFTHLTSTSKKSIFAINSDETFWRVEFQIKMLTYDEQKKNKLYSGLYVDNESTCKGEEEVLFLPYQFFEITHIQKQSSNDKFGYYIISLKEFNEKKLLYEIDQPVPVTNQKKPKQQIQSSDLVNLQTQLKNKYENSLKKKDEAQNQKQEIGKEFIKIAEELKQNGIKINDSQNQVDQYLMDFAFEPKKLQQQLEIQSIKDQKKYVIPKILTNQEEVIYLDYNVNNQENSANVKTLNNYFQSRIKTFDKEQDFLDYINKNGKSDFSVICSGSAGQPVMKKIHDNNKLQKVVIYCQNREFHKQWAKEYAKIILLTNVFAEVMNLLK